MLSLSSCGGDRIVGRFDEALCHLDNVNAGPPTVDKKCNDDKLIPSLAAYVTSIPTPPPAGAKPACTAFEGDAAAECVKAIAHAMRGKDKDADSDAVRQALAKPFDAGDPSPVNRMRFTRNFAITVRRLDYNPSDRIERVDIKIVPDNATFVSWEASATKHKVISLGKLEVNETKKLSASLSPSLPASPVVPISIAGNVSGETTSSRKENLDLANEIEDGVPTILREQVNDKGLSVRSLAVTIQGGLGAAVSGTMLVTATLDSMDLPALYPILKISGLDPANPPASSSLKLTETREVVPTRGGEITAKVLMKYTIRHVRLGDDTLEERDDKAYYIDREATTDALLIPANDTASTGFAIVSRPYTKEARGLYVALYPNDAPIPLCVDSLKAARDLLSHYIAKKSVEDIGSKVVGYNDPPRSVLKVPAGDLDTLRVVKGCNH